MKQDIQYIIRQGETEAAEFKSSFSDDVIIALGAFANTKGGTVYIGISDSGKIIGLELGKETLAQWINEIKNKTAPVIIPDAEIIDEEGKTMVLLTVQEYPVKPVSVRGKYYKKDQKRQSSACRVGGGQYAFTVA